MKKSKSKKPAAKKPAKKRRPPKRPARLNTSVSKAPHASTKPAVHIPIVGGKQIIIVPEKIIQNGQTRPAPQWRDGRPKITFRVWQIADELAATLKRPPTRREMMVACAAEGNDPVTGKPKITYALFSNHFYRWRKFNGINGRLKKDGTHIHCTGGPRKFRTPAPEITTKLPSKPPVVAAPVKPIVAKPGAKPALPFPVPPVAIGR